MKFLILTSLITLTFYHSQAQNSVRINDHNSEAYFEIQDNNSIDFSETLTIESVIKIDSSEDGVNNVLIHKGFCGNYEGGYMLGVKDKEIRFHWSPVGNCNSDGLAETVSADIQDDSCYHIAVTFSPLEINFYVDGVLQQSSIIYGSISPINNNAEPLKIGAYKFISGNLGLFFNGSIDELRLWNVARTAQEIADNYNNEISNPPASLIAYYNMNSFTTGNSILTNQSNLGSALDATVNPSNNYPSSQASCFDDEVASIHPDNLMDSEVIIYPNPSNSIVTIEIDSQFEIQKTQLFSMDGKKIFESKDTNQNFIDVSQYEKGLYTLVLSTSDQSAPISKKMIIE